MLLDKVDVTFKAGDGGNGKVSFKKIGRGPDGGSGGKGGDVYIKSSSDLTILYQFSRQDFLSAENGISGWNNVKSGAKGDDLEIVLPVGTSLINRDTGKEILELTEVGQEVKLLKGGDGGKGNFEFRSSRNTTPMKAQKGFPGESLNLTLNLKLIADFGLIGLPNAGKSSLLNELTNSNAKIGNYAFTTLSPNLGVVNGLPAQAGKIIADIPGLIEGASEGKGLGVNFLKHIEKVKVLLHCIDATSLDYENDYKVIRNELGKYNKELLKKKEIILLCKSDLVKNVVKYKNSIAVSIHDLDSINRLKKLLS
ncbi:MAG: GTPase ObgE [Candidatus Nanoarchaeia archaeon]|nr:GTPase ObgE [Candidatus Nanoarchaeia archaeon]